MLFLRGPLVQLKDFCNRNFLKETKVMTNKLDHVTKICWLFLYIKTEILLLSH